MNPSRSPRRSSAQWQALIDQWRQSDLSAMDFCHVQGLGYAAFCKWRKRFAEGTVEPAPQGGFIDLGALTGSHRAGWHIVLHLGDGVELHLSRP